MLLFSEYQNIPIFGQFWLKIYQNEASAMEIIGFDQKSRKYANKCFKILVLQFSSCICAKNILLIYGVIQMTWRIWNDFVKIRTKKKPKAVD